MNPTPQVRAFREVAKRIGGVVQGRSCRRMMHVEFEIDGIAGRFTAWDPHQGPNYPPRPVMRVRFAWRSPRPLRIGPETLVTRLLRVLGTHDVLIGDRRFDRRFLIQATSIAWARRMLDEKLREAVSAVADHCEDRLECRQWIIDACRSGLQVACWADAAEAPEGAGRFVQWTVSLLRAFRSAQTGPPEPKPALAIVETRESVGQGECLICGADLVAPLRRCETCQTLHHADCWDYLGGCAVFACGSAHERRVEQRAALRREAAARRREAGAPRPASSRLPATPLAGRFDSENRRVPRRPPSRRDRGPI